jgi:ribulose-5-phosphate 4-epimerase/fuculose-1-phosphate aldolase
MAMTRTAAISTGVDPLTQERLDLACAFRWAARLSWHEGVANHFSLAVNDTGSRFMINRGFRHFSLIRASELREVDTDNPPSLEGDDAMDPTAWGLHGGIHRHCPHARCVLHLHPHYGTVLAGLADSTLPPIDQTSARFYNRLVIDDGYAGMAFEEEGERCARLLLADPARKVMVMGNHGVLTIGRTVAEAFDEMYHFERAAETVVTAYMTGRPLRVLPPEVAEHTARQWEQYPGPSAERHFAELKVILDREAPDYRS